MLDVITVVSKTTPPGYVEECRWSIETAASIAGYPVTAITTPGVPGHIGNAMAAGLARCRGEWVCFVDDDDFVLPNAFACLRRHFEKPVDAICAREVQLLANGRLIPQDRRHHLTAFRRSAILGVDLSQFPAFPNVALLRATPNAVDEESWVYVYRRRLSDASRLRGSATVTEREVLRWES